MIPRANIIAWRNVAPWSSDAQVEQDLVLSRATAQMFANADLAGKIALRGGTALNKLFITPGVRYSEDIDLVQTKAGPAGTLIDCIRACLDIKLVGRASRPPSINIFCRRKAGETPAPPTHCLGLTHNCWH